MHKQRCTACRCSPSPSKPLASSCQSWLSHCLSPPSEWGDLFLIVIVWSQLMYNYHCPTGVELYLSIDRNDYVINMPIQLNIKISRTCIYSFCVRESLATVQQSSARPLNFRTFARNMREFMRPTSSDPPYLRLFWIGTFCTGLRAFCTFLYAFCIPISARFVSGACPGIQKSVLWEFQFIFSKECVLATARFKLQIWIAQISGTFESPYTIHIYIYTVYLYY